MNPKQYFMTPQSAEQKKYDALRAYYLDDMPGTEVAAKFGYSKNYFKKIRSDFRQALKQQHKPFFSQHKPGPKKRNTSQTTIDLIVALRKKNYSIQDIRRLLSAQDISIGLNTIDQILKDEGFSPLPRRTCRERNAIVPPEKLTPPKCQAITRANETFYTEHGAGPLIFLPLIQQLGIIPAIQKVGFPSTQKLSDVASVMAVFALKIAGHYRASHDDAWALDRALGLFAELNVLPKNATLASYSYRVTRHMNRQFLLQLCRIFHEPETETGEFNLDFKTIPHWGDESVLETNWAGSRSKRIKSVLALIAQDPVTGLLSYTDAEVKHARQNEAILDFVDFWKEGRGVAPKMLIFDSKLTTYKNLSKLNHDDIKFLTLRRRGKKLIEHVRQIPEQQWQTIELDKPKRKHKKLKVSEEQIHLTDYEGQVRQIILTEHGHRNPTFLVTNDFESSIKTLVLKYARRWLVENEIAEQIMFFHLNQPSSAIVIKVDFDLTLSLLVHNLYKKLSAQLPGFEGCTVPTISRKFILNGARITIEDNTITVYLKKKTHLPILFEVDWMKAETSLSWMDMNIKFKVDSMS
ncbi:MAG: hypothetical protein GY801_29700 [bacterium]|nr:hypothetical protein [bacterium]